MLFEEDVYGKLREKEGRKNVSVGRLF